MAVVQAGTAAKALSGPLLELEQVAVQATRPFPGDTSAWFCVPGWRTCLGLAASSCPWSFIACDMDNLRRTFPGLTICQCGEGQAGNSLASRGLQKLLWLVVMGNDPGTRRQATVPGETLHQKHAGGVRTTRGDPFPGTCLSSAGQPGNTLTSSRL